MLDTLGGMNSKKQPVVITVAIAIDPILTMSAEEQYDLMDEIIGEKGLYIIDGVTLCPRNWHVPNFLGYIPEIDGIVLVDASFERYLYRPQYSEVVAAMRRYRTLIYSPQHVGRLLPKEPGALHQDWMQL